MKYWIWRRIANCSVLTLLFNKNAANNALHYHHARPIHSSVRRFARVQGVDGCVCVSVRIYVVPTAGLCTSVFFLVALSQRHFHRALCSGSKKLVYVHTLGAVANLRTLVLCAPCPPAPTPSPSSHHHICPSPEPLIVFSLISIL